MRHLAACVRFTPLPLLALTVFSACSTTANVSDVYTALDSDGARRRSVFFTDSAEIHCIAEVGVGRPDVTVEGYIHQIRAYDFQSNGFFETDRYLGYVETNPGVSKSPVKVDVTLERVGADGKPKDDEPFTVGSYICEFALDGEIQKTMPFNIDFPPCPAAFISPGTPCYRFYTDGTSCPKYGEKSQDPLKCTCTKTAGWECPSG